MLVVMVIGPTSAFVCNTYLPSLESALLNSRDTGNASMSLEAPVAFPLQQPSSNYIHLQPPTDEGKRKRNGG